MAVTAKWYGKGILNAFGANPVNWISLAFSLVITLVIFISGSFYFRKVERSFADVI